MTSRFESDQVKTDQLEVGKHVKMSSALGKIDVHASGNALGVWITPAGSKVPCGQFGLYVQDGRVCMSLYPDKGYAATRQMPFAISAAGLQVVTSDGRVRILSLEKIAELVDRLISE